MSSQDGSTVYHLTINVLEQRVIGPDHVRNVEKPALPPIGLVYDRIIIAMSTSICLFRIAVVRVMFVRILNMTMFNCLKRDKFHYAVCQTLKKDIFLCEKTVNIFAFIYLQVCVPVNDLASDE